MKNWTQKTLQVVGLATVISSMAMAQVKPTGAQLQCKTKAKEIAKVAYDECMESAKGSEADRIRAEYKLKMAKLKDYYEQKIKKLNIKQKPATVVPATTEATTLPQKLETTLPNSESTVPAMTTSSIKATEPNTPSETTTPTESPSEPVIRLKPANQGIDSQEGLDNGPELSI